MLKISPKDLDTDCFSLSTPEAAYDLRKGIERFNIREIAFDCWGVVRMVHFVYLVQRI